MRFSVRLVANRRLIFETSRGVRQAAAVTTVVVAMALTGPPTAAVAGRGRLHPDRVPDPVHRRCRDLRLTAAITLRVAATSAAAAQGTTWTATGITVSRGAAQISGSGRLAAVTAPRYALRSVVTPPADPIPPGGTGTLDIVVTNDGPSDDPDDTITPLPPAAWT